MKSDHPEGSIEHVLEQFEIALRRFEEGNQPDDTLLAGITALSAAIDALRYLDGRQGTPDYLRPLVFLWNALNDHYEGNSVPMLQAVARKSGQTQPNEHDDLFILGALAVELRCRRYKTLKEPKPLEKACREVAAHLDRQGWRIPSKSKSGVIRARTVKQWRKDLNEGSADNPKVEAFRHGLGVTRGDTPLVEASDRMLDRLAQRIGPAGRDLRKR